MKKHNKYLLVLSLFAFTLFSCETTNLELQTNPSQLSPNSADPNYVLSSISITTRDQIRSLSNVSRKLIRQVNQFSVYTYNVKQETLNSPWENTYAVMSNLQVIEEISASKNLPHHVAIGKILKAVTMMNMVDFIGYAVYDEATNSNFSNPNVNDGEYIYSELINELETAINLIQEDASFSPTDLYYEGDMLKWNKLANSLIIKMLVQSRKSTNFDEATSVAKINDILASGNYMTNFNDDFQYRFGVNLTPDNRHPDFSDNYIDGANIYMSNYFLKLLNGSLGTADPRLNHYIYRQTNDTPTGAFINDCLSAGYTTSQCYIGNGYWGRIHADESGIPNDNLLRATFGAYPSGGAFDNSLFLPVDQSSTLQGAGISPILTSSNIYFLLAEASLTLNGISGSTDAYLELGIQNSLNKVSDFTGENIDVSTFTNSIVDDFNAAVTNDDKLNIIVLQNYIGSFGNGIEPYNAYRRTGFPVFDNSFQDPGTFPRSFFFPESELESNDNPNLNQKALTDQVFWDTNPVGFIN